MSSVSHESSGLKDQTRQEKRRARELVLEKAEADYKRKKHNEEKGNEMWMLPSVEARIKTESKKVKKKKKKNKKERKSSSSSSADESEWVEKPVERDEWMTLPSVLHCVSRDKLKTREDDDKKQKDKYMLDSLGQSERELNPYWRDGGSGLPQTSAKPGPVALASGAVGDGGADWLRRALERAKQQAAEEGRSLEDVAAERWGSLQKLESLLAEAETRSRPDQSGHYKPRNNDRRYRGFRKPGVDASSSQGNYTKSPSMTKSWRKKDSIASSEDSNKHSERSRSMSSSSSSDAESTKESTSDALTEQEMNELGAKIIKAELLGNESLAAELKKRLDGARAARAESKRAAPQEEEKEETVVLTRTDHRGFVRPLQQPIAPEPCGGRRKNRKVETHADGKRVRYFADDDQYSLRDMFEREKMNTVEDQNDAFCKLAAKGVGRPDSEYDMDDLFTERARTKESDGKQQARERERAIREHRRADRALDGCHRCFSSKGTLKHLIVAIASKTYLCLPAHQSLTSGHCLVVPMFHVPCATQLDEDVWAEIQAFRRALTSMFLKQDQDVVFFETAMHLGRLPHMALECVPMPKETGDLAPIYFKKAILECEMEWSTNKKLVDLSQKDVRRAIPKGLPYFSVGFGLEGGFAHVIEDEKLFPHNFAQEIIGGMLDLDHSLWRKQRRDNFDAQCKKVVEFAGWWKPFDFTRKDSDVD